MWTLIILAGLEVYSGAAVHTNVVDGFASREVCEQAVKALKEPPRMYLKAYCVSKG